MVCFVLLAASLSFPDGVPLLYLTPPINVDCCLSGCEAIWTLDLIFSTLLFLQLSVSTLCISLTIFHRTPNVICTATWSKIALAFPSAELTTVHSESDASPDSKTCSGTCSRILCIICFASSLPLSTPSCRGIVASAAPTIDVNNAPWRFDT